MRLTALVLLVAAVVSPVPARPFEARYSGAAGGAVAYQAPLPEPLDVVRPFEAPATPYGPGHRGVDLATAPGQAVRAAAPGVVAVAGVIAGRGVVVVAHDDGIRTEYEPVAPVVAVGTRVAAGAVIGHVSGAHGSCAPGRCLHWGARRGTVYFDPLSLLAPLGPVVLLPLGS